MQSLFFSMGTTSKTEIASSLNLSMPTVQLMPNLDM